MGEAVRSYQDLIVWQLGMKLAEECYRLAAGIPKAEAFGMTSQIRRASTSIPANIAEGWGRQGTKEYLRFLRIAQGSLKELETHLLLSERVGLIQTEKLTIPLQESTELGKMIRSLIGSLRRKLA